MFLFLFKWSQTVCLLIRLYTGIGHKSISSLVRTYRPFSWNNPLKLILMITIVRTASLKPRLKKERMDGKQMLYPSMELMLIWKPVYNFVRFRCVTILNWLRSLTHNSYVVFALLTEPPPKKKVTAEWERKVNIKDDYIIYVLRKVKMCQFFCIIWQPSLPSLWEWIALLIHLWIFHHVFLPTDCVSQNKECDN